MDSKRNCLLQNNSIAVQAPPIPELVTLRDGDTVTIRPVRPDDAPRLQALFARLSPDTVFLRFLKHAKSLSDKDATHLASVDYQTQMALAATSKRCGEDCIIAVARYALIPSGEPGRADLAIVVQDQYQTLGLGTILLQRLAAYARMHGIRAFVANVYSGNTRVLQLLQHSDLPVKVMSRDQETVDVQIELVSGT